MTLLPLETVYTFSIKENGKSFDDEKRDLRLSFFFSFLFYRRIFYNFIHQIEEFINRESPDINEEDDRVDLIGINSPEIDEIRRCSRTRIERNVNKIIAIKPKATRWIES